MKEVARGRLTQRIRTAEQKHARAVAEAMAAVEEANRQFDFEVRVAWEKYDRLMEEGER